MALRKYSAHLFRAVLVFCCLLVVGCFDSREEVWIREDGSARAEFIYRMPARALALAGGREQLEKQIRDLVIRYPELRLDHLEMRDEEGQIVLGAGFSTDSLLWLRNLKRKPGEAAPRPVVKNLTGWFKVKLEGLTLDFSRTLDHGSALGLGAMLIGKEDRQNRRLVQIIHLPKPATQSSATRTEDGGKTLVWDYSLGDALQRPVVASFTAPIPLPRWIIPAGAGLVAALAAASWAIYRCLKKRRLGKSV